MKQGILYINQEGRYAIDDYTYFTCGSAIELEINGRWTETAIEHANGEYYAVGFQGLNLVGYKARTK